MSILPDFNLPSNPHIIVRLREATVGDAIDFSDIDPDLGEAATTTFLERMQVEGQYKTDPRTWTMEDRIYALFMYNLHTTRNRDTPVTYVCDGCSNKAGHEVEHTVPISYATIAEEFLPMEGEPVRDIIHEGHALIVHPILGRDAERMEEMRMDIADWEQAHPRKRARHLRNALAFYAFIAHIDMPALGEDMTEVERRPLLEKYIKEMPASQMDDLRDKVFAAVESLRHGLHTTIIDGRIMLETPPVFCPEGNDELKEGVRLRFPYRPFAFIPHL